MTKIGNNPDRYLTRGKIASKSNKHTHKKLSDSKSMKRFKAVKIDANFYAVFPGNNHGKSGG